MRRTMPKDDVAVIRGEVAVHLAAARGFGSVRRSLNHGLNQPPQQCLVTTALACRRLAESEARIRLFFFTRTTAS